MQPACLLLRLLAASTFVASAAAVPCCWWIFWETQGVYMRWDDEKMVCGIDVRGYPAGSGCRSETTKDDKGHINAVTSLFFGHDNTPFTFRMGVDPTSCVPLRREVVKFGWEGWGDQLFIGSEFTTQTLDSCKPENEINQRVPTPPELVATS